MVAGRAALFQKIAPMATSERTYTDAEVEERLKKELPHWYLEDGWLRRKFKTESWKGTLMVVNTVGHLAEAAWHHPDLTVSYASLVVVKLKTHSAKGITDKDFALASKIEDVIHWQPGQGRRGARRHARRRPALSPTSSTTSRRSKASYGPGLRTEAAPRTFARLRASRHLFNGAGPWRCT